ncbi:MAG: insulinase family protein [Gammaproteobacteria bacterium]|nr:insulinase family protein [Gammaproteobacteria bacterium]
MRLQSSPKWVRFTPFLLGASLLLGSHQAWSTVNIQAWQADNGAKVMFVHAPQLPMLDIKVAFDAGSARDGEQWGVASMMTTLLGLKTTQNSEAELADKMNALGASMGGGVNRDMASFTLRSLTRPSILKPALTLFSETLSQSVFEQSIFDRERKRLLVGLKQQALSPSSMASKAFWKGLYGQHPYGHPVAGSIETVEALTLQEITAFYQTYIVSQNATIAIVGNVDRQQAEAIAEQLLEGLPIGSSPEPIAAPAPVQSTGKSTEIIQFDSSQTYFKMGQIGVERGNPDYYALFLGNHLLGGSGFASLLMKEVREARGLVYGVSSGFAPMRQAGPWIVGLSTKNKTAKEAEKVVNETLAAFMKDFDNAHFQDIKDNLIGGFPLRIDSNAKIIGYISMIGFYGLPLDYLEAFPKAIEKLTKAEVLAAWQRHIHPESMYSVMVGMPE